MRFILTVLLFFSAVCTVCGISEHPFQGVAKNKLVELLNDYGKSILEENEEASRIKESRLRAYMEMRRGDVFDGKIPAQIDLDRLPMMDWTLNELIVASDKGNADAALHIVSRFMEWQNCDYASTNAHLWNTYSNIQKWLKKAEGCGRAGVRLIHEIYMKSESFELEPQSVSGYEDFIEQIRKGDAILTKLAIQMHHPKLTPIIQRELDGLKIKGEQGDVLAQRAYVELSQFKSCFMIQTSPLYFQDSSCSMNPRLPKYAIRYDDAYLVEWSRKFADEGDFQCIDIWLDLCLNGEMTEEDIDRVFKFCRLIVEQGYMSSLLKNYSYGFRAINIFKEGYQDCSKEYRSLISSEWWWQALAIAINLKKQDRENIPKARFTDEWERLFEMGDVTGIYSLPSWEHDRQVITERYLGVYKQRANEGDVDACCMLAGLYAEIEEFASTDNWQKARCYAMNALDIITPHIEAGFKPLKRIEYATKIRVLGLDQKLVKEKKKQEDVYRQAYLLYEELKQAGSNRLGELCCMLGNWHEEGYGTPQDMVQAVKFYQEGVDAGNWDARLYLSRCYEEGRGIPKDKEKAKTLYEKYKKPLSPFLYEILGDQ